MTSKLIAGMKGTENPFAQCATKNLVSHFTNQSILRAARLSAKGSLVSGVSGLDADILLAKTGRSNQLMAKTLHTRTNSQCLDFETRDLTLIRVRSKPPELMARELPYDAGRFYLYITFRTHIKT